MVLRITNYYVGDNLKLKTKLSHDDIIDYLQSTFLMSQSQQDIFFREYGIGSEDELVLLEDRFRDASRHYYHAKTDRVYTRGIFREKPWSFCKEMQFLVEKHKNPEEYQRKLEEGRKKTQEIIEARDKKLQECRDKYLPLADLLQKHSSQGFVRLSRSFLDDLIANRHFMAWGLVNGDDCIPVSAITCEIGEVSIDTDDQSDHKAYGPNHQRILTKNYPIRKHDIIYEVQGENIFIDLNDLKAKVNSEHIYVIRSMAYTQIRFLQQVGDSFQPAEGIKFKALDLDSVVFKLNFIGYLDEAHRFVYEDGAARVSDQEKHRLIMPNQLAKNS